MKLDFEQEDQLYLIAEQLSQNFSLFPSADNASASIPVKGLLSEQAIEQELAALKEKDVEEYIAQTVLPAEDPSRLGARAIIAKLGGKVIHSVDMGPLYAVELELDFGRRFRRVGIIAQDRAHSNGVWMPEHHRAAVTAVRRFAQYSMPIVTFMDTPGADASEAANLNNQAHSISHLIAEMCNVDVPTVGIILGLGYSGGAIPLASCNLVLAVRDGVFNTIQPKGLANISRKYNLSWEECAQFVGVSAYELYRQRNIDGIIDFVPGEKGDKLENLRLAIVTAIDSIEAGAKHFVAENSYILDHYARSIARYLKRDETALQNNTMPLSLAGSPTEHLNVFGISYRYLRYLGLRQRIRSINQENYGRLADQEVPRGKLEEKQERERTAAFLQWLQDPDKVVYDDVLAKAWRNFNDKRNAVHDERGFIGKLFLGEPKQNYENAKRDLVFSLGLFLYNRWKGDAADNIVALARCLRDYDQTQHLLRVDAVIDANSIADAIFAETTAFTAQLKQRFSHYGRQVLSASSRGAANKQDLVNMLCFEFNQLLLEETLFDATLFTEDELPAELSQKLAGSAGDAESIATNRAVLNAVFAKSLQKPQTRSFPEVDATLLDIAACDDLRELVIAECENLLIFGSTYDHIIQNLVSVAKEANTDKVLSKASITKLLETAASDASVALTNWEILDKEIGPDELKWRVKEQFAQWVAVLSSHKQKQGFLKSVEEWKKGAFPRISDTLFVVITLIFERLLPEYFVAESGEKRFEGRINPSRIGKRKDFWNRLSIAYVDLLVQQLLQEEKRKKRTTASTILEHFVTDFSELNASMMTCDPVEFPGLRLSVEQAIANDVTPAGAITGIGQFKLGEDKQKVGLLVSNLAFQAGAFDMASAEKFCKLLVECSKQKLPVIAFVSSGGMQTKEGAAALFPMAVVNDRITRFVRDNDLPIIVFGFGDCTGGAQASFVTHPLVQTYYFSGADIPFAGRIVVPSYLPSTATVANYLSRVQGSMQGLVKHPFATELDANLLEVDPTIPVPRETVEDVVKRVLGGMLTPQETVSEQAVIEAADPTTIQPAPVEKTLIHARGCTAVKLIRIAQQQNIAVVLVQSDPDMDSVSVDMLGDNDRVVCIGGNTSDESYLNALSVLEVAKHEGVDSLHPGIGFLSENSQFASLVRNNNINFIGPPVRSMETMGNKSNAINTALANNVPVVPGSHGILTSSDKAAAVATQIEYPVLIKAVHGGGGKGIQVVRSADEIHELFHQVSQEAKSAFGNGDIYLEKFVTSMRHIEVQVLRDSHGNTLILGLRDCSVQRNNQKIFEESDSTMLPDNLRQLAYSSAESLACAVDYVGAGTVEFIFDLDNDTIYFMEMNTRLQVEHPVTEKVTGIDIVAAQFDIAAGKSISGLQIEQNGYAIEVRINAEKAVIDADGSVSFMPTPGKLVCFELPEEPGIELISMVAEGKSVSPFYDSLIIQIIAHDKDRDSTIKKLHSYLGKISIEGICCNIPLVTKVLEDTVFINGIYDTNYLPDFLGRINAPALIEAIETKANLAAGALSLDDLRIEGSSEIRVVSPSSGVFYTTPSPSEPDFVKVGDVIDVEKTICTMEAMKMFTPLSLASFNKNNVEVYPNGERFVVARINNVNGQQVNAGDLLFVIKPM